MQGWAYRKDRCLVWVIYIDSRELQLIPEEKNLGAVVMDDLRVSRPYLQSYNKAIRILGLINRSITIKSRYVMLNLNTTLVRPHVEN